MQSGDKKSIWPKSKKAPLLHDFFSCFFCALFFCYIISLGGGGGCWQQCQKYKSTRKSGGQPSNASEREGWRWVGRVGDAAWPWQPERIQGKVAGSRPGPGITNTSEDNGVRTTKGSHLPDVLVAQLDGLRFAQLLAVHQIQLLVGERHF